MTTAVKCFAEVRDRAVRMVLEHHDGYGSQWAAISSIAARIAARRRCCAGGRSSASVTAASVPG